MTAKSHETFNPFRAVPRTGVIFVSEEAALRGYRPGHPDWANLGQGQPETGPLPGAPERLTSIALDPDDHEYAPVAGLRPLREAVASLYNQLYRRGLASQYTADNVAIASGGRVALARVMSAVGQVNVGHFLPDYTAYEELLEVFRAFHPIPILLEASLGYRFSAAQLEQEIRGRGLGAVLVSNPCNPTGRVIQGDELARWVGAARAQGCALLFDEFYGNYVYGAPGSCDTLSAARYVDDVDRDPVVLLNGLTKGWRYPGWRISWVVGPRSLIEAVSSAGSFLDGGAPRPLQRAALELVTPAYVAQEARAVQTAFAKKRTATLAAVQRMGMRVDAEPEGTFYVWANLEGLPPPLNDGMQLFRRALDEKVIVIPGEFFDVNPGHRRPRHSSRFKQYARISFGPNEAEVQRGLERLERLIRTARG